MNRKRLRFPAALLALVLCAPLHAAIDAPAPLPSLAIDGYLGTWHQLALYPNRFQNQCVADTTASYALRVDGAIEVRNRCRTASGAFDEAVGVAKPRGAARIRDGALEPASLAVSFLPTWLRWLPVGWGDYDVVQRLEGGSISIVSEPSREYLWVLSRARTVSKASWQGIEAWLGTAGFDLARLQRAADAVEP